MRISRTIITFRNILAVTALVSAMLAFSPLASAAIITWTLEDVTFAGGETVSGWFQVDASSSWGQSQFVDFSYAWNLTFGGLPSYDPTSLVGTVSACNGCGNRVVVYNDNNTSISPGGVITKIAIQAIPEGNEDGSPFVFIEVQVPSIPLDNVGHLYDVGNYVVPLDVSQSSIFYGKIGFPFYISALITGKFVQTAKPDLSISKHVDIAQVVFNPDINNDGKIDLVLGKETVILATVKATGVSPTDTRQVTFGVTLCGTPVAITDMKPSSLSLGQIPPAGTEVQLYFTPSITGNCDLVVTVNPDKTIAESDATGETNNSDSTSVDVKPVRTVVYTYFAINYLDSVPQFSQTVANSGDYLLAVYPLAPAQFLNEEIDTPFIPNLGGLLPNQRGAQDDARYLWLEGKLLTGFSVERIVGIVPKLWFTYHQFGDSTEGAHFPMVNEVAFVLDNRPFHHHTRFFY